MFPSTIVDDFFVQQWGYTPDVVIDYSFVFHLLLLISTNVIILVENSAGIIIVQC